MTENTSSRANPPSPLQSTLNPSEAGGDTERNNDPPKSQSKQGATQGPVESGFLAAMASQFWGSSLTWGLARLHGMGREEGRCGVPQEGTIVEPPVIYAPGL